MMSVKEVHLGYAVGSGDAVRIPIRHMVVAGQTQEAGKTTTLEALIARSQWPAVAFVTKRGEGAFGDGRRIAPYFRERADWQFVASVLEATMRERLKFERAWIMRASKSAQTLADVQTNVRRLMVTAKGMSADVYLTLDSYLDIVVPRIANVAFASTVDLAAGVNVLDLSDRDLFPSELQALVMRSVLEWIYEHAQETITIIPEAWEFLPQGRGSPVKLAAVELIRKGAGLRNYVWLDSQDIGGIDKELLRSCPVWLLGVQREANEIKRLLDNIPAGVAKPKATDVATLDRGQFYACWNRNVIRTYVQPAWMDDSTAAAVARGDRSLDSVPRPATRKPSNPPSPQPKGVPVSQATDAKLDKLLSLLERQLSPSEPAPRPLPAAPTPLPGSPPARPDWDAMYEHFRSRFLSDPAVLRVLVDRPTIEVEVDIPTIEMDGKSLNGRIARLIHGDYFTSKRRHADVKRELERTGPEVNNGNLSRALKEFVRIGFLTDEGDGYLPVKSMKVNIVQKGKR